MNTKDARKMFYSPDTKFSRAENRALAREKLIYNVTEDLLVLLEKVGVSKVELSRRLGRSRAYVSQLLDGSRNMTLGTLADICFALGGIAKVSFETETAEAHCNAHWETLKPLPQPLKPLRTDKLFENHSHRWQTLGEAA